MCRLHKSNETMLHKNSLISHMTILPFFCTATTVLGKYIMKNGKRQVRWVSFTPAGTTKGISDRPLETFGLTHFFIRFIIDCAKTIHLKGRYFI